MRDVAKEIKRNNQGRKLKVTDFSDEGPDAHVRMVQVDADASEQQEQTGSWDVESLSQLRCIHEFEPGTLIEQADADSLIEGLE